MDVLALLLADSRFPGGGHVHSGGLEEAAARGLVRTEEDLPAFLRNRLHTAGALSATFAAASAVDQPDWPVLDAELDARTPSAAQRTASRAQGRATARAAKLMTASLTGQPTPPPDAEPVAHPGSAIVPRLARDSPAAGQAGDPVVHCGSAIVPVPARYSPAAGQVRDPVVHCGSVTVPAPARDSPIELVRDPVGALLAVTPRPHHPLVLGAVVGAGGGAPAGAALVAAYLAVSGPASAGVRLLGLDPLRVNGIVAALAPEVAAVAGAAAAVAHLAPAQLPAPGSPGLDLLAEEHDRHHREEVRLFVS